MTKNKIQIMMIHGGMTFKNKKDYLNYLKTRNIKLEKSKYWSDDSYIYKSLGKNIEIIKPNMPLKENAYYSEWKINFERYFPFLRDNIILIGSSLGGIFLAKYLSENKFPKKILSTYLVCPPFKNDSSSEDLVGGFKLKSNLSRIEKNSENTTLLFSEDDNVVPIRHAEKYRKKLKNARIISYKSKNGHFNISSFPEIIKMIKQDIKRIKG